MRNGRRTGERGRPRLRPDLLLLAGGVTVALVAWGYLVFSAIDFGASARHDGRASAWLFMVIATLGAVLCLFLAAILVIRIARALGLTGPPPPPRPKRDPAAPKGGKRAAR